MSLSPALGSCSEWGDDGSGSFGAGSAGCEAPGRLRVPLALGFLQSLPVFSCLKRGKGMEFVFDAANPAKEMMLPAVPCGFQFDFFLFSLLFLPQHPSVRAGGAHGCEHEQSLHGGDGQAQELREPEAVSAKPLGRLCLGQGLAAGSLMFVTASAAQQVSAQEKWAQSSTGTLRFPS